MSKLPRNKLICLLFTLLFTAAALIGCGSQQTAVQPDQQEEPVKLMVSAAKSLSDAAAELKEIYEEEHSNVTITYNFGASGTLQKQIEEGAPADIFISAGVKQMDALAEQDLIVADTRSDLLGNELVLIVKEGIDIQDFDGLADSSITKMSIGVPETVPAGKYAKEALTNLGLWEKVESKIVYAKDVRQVLTYVETGNVDAGLVYRSDVIAAGEKAKIVAAAPADSHKPIIYPMAILKNSEQQEEAAKFLEFLQSDQAAEVFEKYGFQPLKK
jgi:molybdate transport system substrate-binding protein